MAGVDKTIIPVWGGIECTVHRLKDEYRNQLDNSGHQTRISDLELIAALGIKTLRYPVVWESVAPNGLKKADWSWVDERLEKLQGLGITPIAGLLHHGSGPSYTSLTDPDFAEKFTEYAVAVAERYPWLELFTPINEPLTTARFSCLYGHWYPHSRDAQSFSTALLNQCKATVMAMKAIKRIIPNAQLVQTEDMGKCHSTKKMAYQCRFENERRWSSLDLLCGKIQENSLMTGYLLELGKVSEKELEYFSSNHYAPDIIGINHYITSERFLDENMQHYPAWSHAGNGRDRYADVDVVRADINKRAGHYNILKEAAERYNLPLALTEVHLGATREEQLRWFMEAWNAVCKLKHEGVDIRGITAWSMLGAYDWNTLLTQKNNFYESGVFDVRSGKPRPTALAWLIKKLANGETPAHPVLEADGWWKNPGASYFNYSGKPTARELPQVVSMKKGPLPEPPSRTILITGATGTLGRAFARICKIRNISYHILSRQELDITSQESIENALRHYQPWAVINTAGYVKVDEAERMQDRCFLENTEGPALLAAACLRYNAQFTTFSTDLVFDGKAHSPYLESNPAAPLNVYGLSKLCAETKVLKVNPAALVIRTSSFFGPWDEYNFISQMVRTLEENRYFFASKDHIVSPTYIPDLVNNTLDLILDRAAGIWHLTNPSEISLADFAFRTAEIANLNPELIKATEAKQLGYKAIRPTYSALGSEKGILLPQLDDAISRYIRERETAATAPVYPEAVTS
ncbi:family 1 glycosylhydrolase [Cesiribacter sp. SM1]|uniref:family 1 glycosylhydrolase n=1 Tax=Cesiribacter sp. SM1 TaxID=2861196 RepID=UPI001CD70C69|nr:family 1 glycosylhydrolase [Cesiribacter sp. SM1]